MKHMCVAFDLLPAAALAAASATTAMGLADAAGDAAAGFAS